MEDGEGGSWEVQGGLVLGTKQDVSSSVPEEGPGMVAGGAQRSQEQVSRLKLLAHLGGLCKFLPPPFSAES